MSAVPAPRHMPITRYFLLSLVLLTLTASLGPAQNTTCDTSQFDAMTNMWKLEPDQNTREVTPGELAAERKIMQRVVDMFKSAFVRHPQKRDRHRVESH